MEVRRMAHENPGSRWSRSWKRSIAGGLAAGFLALLPGAAQAETRQFLLPTQLFPTGGALTEGPASDYPSTITVAGVPGTVTRVEASVLGMGSARPDDIDMVLIGPNGSKVLLMADACGTDGISHASWTFKDDAPGFISNNGPCQGFSTTTFRPSNYVGNDGVDDNLSSVPGGPPPPYVNNLASLTGGSANGDWSLFVLDDESGFNGFDIDGWGLTIETDAAPGPVNTARPRLSGKAKTGKKLTCSPGRWTGEPSLAFGWLRNGAPIAGETSATLKLKRRDAGRAIQCEVTATDAGGNATEQSAPVVPKKGKRKRR